jgi:hypothetical protein
MCGVIPPLRVRGVMISNYSLQILNSTIALVMSLKTKNGKEEKNRVRGAGEV